MTPMELVGKLRDDISTRVSIAQEGTDPAVTELCEEALQNDFLEDTVARLYDILQRPFANEAEFVGVQEENGFLACFQRAYQNRRKTRMQKWAEIYSALNSQASDIGVLNKQMATIGTKVDSEMIADILPENANGV